MKVIIAGGRYFNDYHLLRKRCNFFLKNTTDIEVVSGHQKGTDQLGERYAKEMGYPVKVFYADWNLYRNAAGPIRNGQMAKYAKNEYLIAFWDGVSKGTANMINQAKEQGLKIKIVMYDTP